MNDGRCTEGVELVVETERNGDLHLAPDSPALHGADPSDTLDVDLEGGPRPNPVASTSDIGAYESAN